MGAVHASPYSGRWYPSSEGDLNTLLDELFGKSEQRAPYVYLGAFGLVVPHAGPVYSGTVAAASYRALAASRPERVVLLAFPHRGGLRGVAAPDVEAISTPLGMVAVDSGYGGFPRAPEARLCDHSLEIQLPFLQRVAPGAAITPLYVGGGSAGDRAEAADRLASLWRKGVMFVASSDFTHYGESFHFTPFPADSLAQRRIRNLDFECIEAAGTLDSERFLAAIDDTGATVCGVNPIALMLDVMSRIDAGLYTARLDYQTSGELEGDFRHSVSYAALGFYPRQAFDIPAQDQRALLDSASATLKHLRETGQKKPIPASGGSSAIEARRGAFVTLHRGDELLGCIGNRSGRSPIAEEIAELTLAAATDDPRFTPAARTEGPIDIEISLLTPFRRIFSEEECVAGKHGVFIERGGRSGLLLPQVAAERGWSTPEFLEALTRKAMLGPHVLNDPETRLYVFEAQLFKRKQAA